MCHSCEILHSHANCTQLFSLVGSIASIMKVYCTVSHQHACAWPTAAESASAGLASTESHGLISVTCSCQSHGRSAATSAGWRCIVPRVHATRAQRNISGTVSVGGVVVRLSSPGFAADDRGVLQYSTTMPMLCEGEVRLPALLSSLPLALALCIAVLSLTSSSQSVAVIIRRPSSMWSTLIGVGYIHSQPRDWRVKPC